MYQSVKIAADAMSAVSIKHTYQTFGSKGCVTRSLIAAQPDAGALLVSVSQNSTQKARAAEIVSHA